MESLVTIVLLKSRAYDFRLNISSITLVDDVIGVYPVLSAVEKEKVAYDIFQKFCSKYGTSLRKFKQERENKYFFECPGPIGFDSCEGIISFQEMKLGEVILF